MLNIDLEPLKQLYQEILNTQALSEKELKELSKLINSLQETKEEFENSSFSVLKKNTELFNNSNSILQKIEKLSIFLENLEDEIKKEKLTFNDEIKQKMQNMLKSVETDLNSLKLLISNKKADFEKEFNAIKKLYSDNNAKLSSLTQETEKIGQEYSKTLKSSLNSFKKQIEEYKEEFENEIKKKTFFQRWGAVIIALSIGFLAGAGGMFYIKAKAIRKVATTDLSIIKKEYNQDINKINALIGTDTYQRFIKPYEIGFVSDDKGYQYVVIPKNKVKQVYTNDKLQIIKLKKQ